MMIQSQFSNAFKNKKIFITGHTGFKGSWLSLWLTNLGAEVYGYALSPPTSPSLFNLLDLTNIIHSELADIRDKVKLKKMLSEVKPDIIFHLAAQSVVRESYVSPYETVEINTIGTINLMEAVRELSIPVALIMITSDKSYENREWYYGYRETDPLGGYDPYSASKGAADLLINSWRNSFFHPDDTAKHGVRIATARAGNVVGGGDWTKDALVPDCIRALQLDNGIAVRSPHATRPWQHVLEPLSGYLQLGARLMETGAPDCAAFCEAFNFGPYINSNKTVMELVEKLIQHWGSGSWHPVVVEKPYHEASLLHLSIDKAYHKLRWLPKWNFDETISHTVEWYKVAGQDPSVIREFTLEQIKLYQNGKNEPNEQFIAEEINLTSKY